MGNSACLAAEMLYIVAGQMHTEHFDSSPRSKVNMFSQVDISKATLPQQANKAIIPKLLSQIGQSCFINSYC